jgi:hypothetical protein
MLSAREMRVPIECDVDGISLDEFKPSDVFSRQPSTIHTDQQTTLKHSVTSEYRPYLQTSSEDLSYYKKGEISLAEQPLKLQQHLLQKITVALLHALLTLPFFVYGFMAWRLDEQPIRDRQIWIVRYGIGKKVSKTSIMAIRPLKTF